MTNAGSAKTILVVDDHPQLLDLVKRSLELLGHYQVFTAGDGAQGLERYVEIRPDCVVIDVKMPGVDGYQLVRAIRGDPETARTPLVILSAMAQEKDQLGGLLAGADVYLLKPVEPPDLVAAIDRAIALSEEERHQRLKKLAEQDEPPSW